VLVVNCSTQHFRGRPGCLLQVPNCPEPSFMKLRHHWFSSFQFQWRYYKNLRKDVENPKRSFTVIWCFFLFPQALPLSARGFLLSLNHDWFACQLQRAEFLRKGSHKGPLFRMFPLSLQSIISNQMRPRKLRGAWFSHLLRHLARKRSGSILSPRTHTGCPESCRDVTERCMAW